MTLPWFVAGPLLGLCIVALRATLNKPFGALGGYIELAENARRPGRLGTRAFLLIGIALGGTLFAVTLGSLGQMSYGPGSFVPTSGPAQIVTLLGAGVAIGFGARTAGGCTSGHGMSGVSIGSPASLVATMTFFATAVGLSFLMAAITGGAV